MTNHHSQKRLARLRKSKVKAKEKESWVQSGRKNTADVFFISFLMPSISMFKEKSYKKEGGLVPKKLVTRNDGHQGPLEPPKRRAKPTFCSHSSLSCGCPGFSLKCIRLSKLPHTAFHIIIGLFIISRANRYANQ